MQRTDICLTDKYICKERKQFNCSNLPIYFQFMYSQVDMNCTFQETVGTEFEFPVQRLLASDRKKSLFSKFAKIKNSTTGFSFLTNT